MSDERRARESKLDGHLEGSERSPFNQEWTILLGSFLSGLCSVQMTKNILISERLELRAARYESISKVLTILIP